MSTAHISYNFQLKQCKITQEVVSFAMRQCGFLPEGNMLVYLQNGVYIWVSFGDGG